MGSLDNASETLINITGAGVTEATISNLMLDTNYFIQVAAVNNAVTGVFSNAIITSGKNHFYKMKGDVGMSIHEKGRNKKMPTPRHKLIHNPIPTSLF